MEVDNHYAIEMVYSTTSEPQIIDLVIGEPQINDLTNSKL